MQPRRALLDRMSANINCNAPASRKTTSSVIGPHTGYTEISHIGEESCPFHKQLHTRGKFPHLGFCPSYIRMSLFYETKIHGAFMPHTITMLCFKDFPSTDRLICN
ncbi:hypothetical protein ANPL_03340 [Anaplasma platys]|uniref:Uncharacterized protein n=1 Tax=Anaplasma platys TaxID=949 RepID=A0A858PYP2_9RICK|nr:hypothetical protein ANPL_03340 [Anaplasma platys]